MSDPTRSSHPEAEALKKAAAEAEGSATALKRILDSTVRFRTEAELVQGTIALLAEHGRASISRDVLDYGVDFLYRPGAGPNVDQTFAVQVKLATLDTSYVSSVEAASTASMASHLNTELSGCRYIMVTNGLVGDAAKRVADQYHVTVIPSVRSAAELAAQLVKLSNQPG